MFAGKSTELSYGATLHFKIDDDRAGLLVCADTDLVGIKVFTGKLWFAAGIVLGELGRVQRRSRRQGSLAGIPEFQVSRSQDGPDLLILVTTV